MSPGDNTFANYQEANRTFWRNTVIPLATRAARALADWLGPAYATTLTLRPGLDQIEALAPEREASCRRQASKRVDPPRKSILPHRRRKTRRRRVWPQPAKNEPVA